MTAVPTTVSTKKKKKSQHFVKFMGFPRFFFDDLRRKQPVPAAASATSAAAHLDSPLSPSPFADSRLPTSEWPSTEDAAEDVTATANSFTAAPWQRPRRNDRVGRLKQQQ